MFTTLRSLLNELARLTPNLDIKRASSFNRDLRVGKGSQTSLTNEIMQIFLITVKELPHQRQPWVGMICIFWST